MNEQERRKNKIRGCLVGGAAGDALGYAVEFMDAEGIFRRYGPGGITRYALSAVNGKALISDDTQMTLFTANGLLLGGTRANRKDQAWRPSILVPAAYQDWLRTQTGSWEQSRKAPREEDTCTWLAYVPELYSRRAPGNTCMSSLLSQRSGADIGTVDRPINHSSGCGGVMRVAPMGLLYAPAGTARPQRTEEPPASAGQRGNEAPCGDIADLDREGAEIAAVTHGNPLGYLPAAMLTHIVSRLVYPPKEQTLKEIVREARDTVAALFPEQAKPMGELDALLSRAVDLSENGEKDPDNIRRLGEGWTGDEALAIAVYCALRHQDDFSAGVIAAVNHSGDSDSTGAVAGNILGAKLGFSAIGEQWKTDLELYDVILTIADDLTAASLSHDGLAADSGWRERY